jgi:hypothetical protein
MMSCANCLNYGGSGYFIFMHNQTRRTVLVADRPIKVEPGINKIAARIRDLDRADLKLVSMVVTRPGAQDWLLYPAFERDEAGAVVFLLDDHIFSLPPGRWYGQIEYDGCCWRIQLELPGCAPVESVTLDHQPEFAGRGD